MSKTYTYATRPTSAREQYTLAYQCARRNKPMIHVVGNPYMAYTHECLYYDIPARMINAAYDSWKQRNSGIDNRSLFDRLYDRLVKRYAEDIRESFDWESLKAEASDTIEDNLSDWGEASGSVYLGSVMALYPSGKYLHILAGSNWDDTEALKDRAYSDALDIVAEEHGGSIDSSEGDPTDVLFVINWE